MSLSLAALEVMDKEPPLWFIFLAFFVTGAVGMLIARRRPILSALFVTVTLLGAFALYLEWSDSFVRESIIKEAGIAYLGGSVAAILAGIALPLFGALAGSKKLRESAPAWRWISGVSGGVLLGLTLFMCSGFVESLYYDYIFYPRVKAQDHYIMPLRWQDITAESLIACVLIALLFLSAYLLRSAFRHQKKSGHLVSSW
jgi:MFS family permease